MKQAFLLLMLTILLPLSFCGQSRWLRTYHDDWDSQITDIINSYDDGYILCGRRIDGSFARCWLLKTDINGEPLWEKIIAADNGYISPRSVSRNHLGEIFLAGMTLGEFSTNDPIVIKLDACGEKEWCRVIQTVSEYDYAWDIVGLDNGGCTFSLKYSGGIPGGDRVCLMNLDAGGNFMWKQCYDDLDTNVSQPDHQDLLLTPDGGYLITGQGYFDTIPLVYGLLKPFLIKTDSLGNAQWMHIIEKDSVSKGESFQSAISPNGQYYCTALRHLPVTYTACPAVAFTSTEGELIRLIELDTTARYGQLTGVQFINDTLLAAVGFWGEEWADRKAIVFDTSGNIIHQISYLEGSFNEMVRVVKDDKLLILTQKSDHLNNFHTYLLKFNDQLIDDTLYLQPFNYDSLCSYPPPYDTLYLDDCDLILGVNDGQDEPLNLATGIKIYPNPCRDFLEIELPVTDGNKIVSLYNVFGQTLFLGEYEPGDRNVAINTANFSGGMILARIYISGKEAYSFKIIKM